MILRAFFLDCKNILIVKKRSYYNVGNMSPNAHLLQFSCEASIQQTSAADRQFLPVMVKNLNFKTKHWQKKSK